MPPEFGDTRADDLPSRLVRRPTARVEMPAMWGRSLASYRGLKNRRAPNRVRTRRFPLPTAGHAAITARTPAASSWSGGSAAALRPAPLDPDGGWLADGGGGRLPEEDLAGVAG